MLAEVLAIDWEIMVPFVNDWPFVFNKKLSQAIIWPTKGLNVL
jgi:hypothetical protein